jgi:hypothetical protein
VSAPSIQVARGLLGPVLGLIGLTYLSALAILVTSVRDLRDGRSVRFYEDYVGGGPQPVERTKRQLANLFEFPVLFFAAVCLACACGVESHALRIMAWLYAALRWAHAIVHLTPKLNRLWLRTPVFMMSNLLLLAFWGVLAARIGDGA